MNLYAIDSEIAALIDPETGEITDMEAFEALNMERQNKLEWLALIYKNENAEAEAIKAEEKALKERREACEKRAASAKKALETALNGESLKTTKVACTFRKAERVEIADISLLPPEFLRTKDPEADKNAIKLALKAGEKIAGASLVQTVSMSIK